VSTVANAASIEDEEAVLGICECGADWSLMSEHVIPLRGRWYDSLVVACPICGRYRRAVFDITSFFVPAPKVWSQLR
jgi:hypothetical protein